MTYAPDVLGRRTAQIREDGVRESYGYDLTSQVTGVLYGTSYSETFAYDPVGNRTEVGRVIPNAPPACETYTAKNLNQYTSLSFTPDSSPPVSFAYDPNGNLIDDGRRTYRYDSQNRLLEVETKAGVTPAARAEFFYDARNRCVVRKFYTRGSQGQWVLDTSASRAQTYDRAWNLLMERTLSGSVVAKYTHGLRTDEVLAADLSSTRYYPLADGLGSTVALTKSNGTVAERFRYTAYGQPSFLSASHGA